MLLSICYCQASKNGNEALIRHCVAVFRQLAITVSKKVLIKFRTTLTHDLLLYEIFFFCIEKANLAMLE